MGDENHIRTLRDYSKPSHEGYRNTVELPVRNNVVPLGSDTIGKKERSEKTDVTTGDDFEKPTKTETEMPSRKPRRRMKLETYQTEKLEKKKQLRHLALNPGKKERSEKTNVTTGDDFEKPTKTETEMPVKEAEKEDEAGNVPNRKARKEETTEAPSSQPVEYYLKHMINKKLIEGLVGIAEDLLVEVAEHVYPVEFVILDIKEDEKRPFILGTPFLTTAKVVIKFDKGTITLRSRKSKISIHRIPKSLYKIERGVKNDIEPIAPIITVNRLVLEWEERIKLHLVREMEFDQWKSKNFKGKHLILVKIEGGIDDE
nr:hypothetical protein [Tanacetum cinerariifolium]